MRWKSLNGFAVRKKNLLILIYILYLLSSPSVYGQKVLAVQSARFIPYEEVYKGFKDIYRKDIARVVIAELGNVSVTDKIKEIKPDVILAIGIDALLETKDIRDIPIIHAMTLNARSILSDNDNITGVDINISPERQLSIISKILPEIKKIGLIYNPGKTGYLAGSIQESAKKTDIEITAYKVNESSDVPTLVNKMKGQIDLLWMMPDTTVVTPETVEFMLLFSIENRTPVASFSKKHVEMGALISISAAPFAMGQRAGEVANKILSDKNYRNEGEIYVREESLFINMNAAKKLGIVINKKNMKKAEIIE